MGFNVATKTRPLTGQGMLNVIKAGGFSRFCGNYFGGNLGRATSESRLGTIANKLEDGSVSRLATFDVSAADRAAMSIGKGRVCILGEHLDHDLGPTISVPMQNGTICVGFAGSGSAQDRGKIIFANTDPRFETFVSTVNEDPGTIPQLVVSRTTSPAWHFYPSACIIKMMEMFPTLRNSLRNSTTSLVFDGKEPYGVPVSSGLSSSAAIENATLITLLNLFRSSFPSDVARSTLAELAVAAENSFANCGRLDQHTSIAPEDRQGVKLDYWHMVRGNWDKAYEFFNLPDNMLLGVVSSDQPASTAQAGYRVRRLSGWAFASVFFSSLMERYGSFSKSAKEFLDSDEMRKNAPSLRDVYDFAQILGLDPLAMYDDMVCQFCEPAYDGDGLLRFMNGYHDNPDLSDKLLSDCGLNMGDIADKRVFKPGYGRYILAEQARVQRAYEQMSAGNYEALKNLISATHYGMSDTYEAGTEQNTRIVDILAALGIHSRIVGAGFGGYNMFAIFGKTADERESQFEVARQTLQEQGYGTCFMAPPGCGSAVFEADAN